MAKTVEQIANDIVALTGDSHNSELVARYIRENYLTKSEAVEVATKAVKRVYKKRTVYSEKFSGISLEIG